MSDDQKNDFVLADNFKEKYSGYSDQEIKSILKNRDHYQPAAARAAVEEAIKRGIIFSEQDLFAEEYKSQPLRFSLFPVPEKDHSRHKLRNSLLRIVLFVGLIPMIHGMIIFRSIDANEEIMLILSGLIWMAFTGLLYKTRQNIFLYILFVIAFISLFYTVNHIINLRDPRFMDYLIPVVVYLLVFYFLTYLRVLRNHDFNME